MKGLLYKDLCLLKNVWKTYAGIFAVFGALTLAGLYDISFLFTMTVVMICTYPSTTFAYDEQAKWDRFAVAVPGGRRRVVRDKYRFALLLTGMALAGELALSLILALLGRAPLGETLSFCLGGVAGALLVHAVLLPCLFRFGAQKARLITMAVGACLGGAMVAAYIVGEPGGDPGSLAVLLLGGFLLLALAAFPVSYKVSLGIYQKKEF